MAKFTTPPVPGTRRGKPGVQRQRTQAPIVWVSGETIAETTSALYPQPARARMIATVKETAAATTSSAEVTENIIARLSRARCRTEVLVKKMVSDIAAATGATSGFL